MTMGMVRLREEKFDEARQYLDKAVSENSNNQFACYRYAFVLLRSGTVSKETAEKSLALLKRSVELDPKFFPSYSLMAFAALASGVGMDDATSAVSSALKFKPNDASLLLDLASLYLRSDRVEDAGKLAEKAAMLTDDPGLKDRAQSITSFVAMTQRNGGDTAVTYSGPVSGGTSAPPELSEEEQQKAAADFMLQNINNDIGPLGKGLERVVGKIEKITCPNGTVRYSVRSGEEVFTLSSTDFQGLKLMVYGGKGGGAVGCDADLSDSNAVLTYKPAAGKVSKVRGELIAIDFVPDDFRLMDADELTAANDTSEKEEEAAKAEALQRFPSTRTLLAGEKRVLGVFETLECGRGMPVLLIRTADRTLKLSLPSGRPFSMVTKMTLTSFPKPDCGMAPWKNRVVVIYKEVPDKKLKTDGTVSALELVPDEFELNEP